MMLYDKVMEQAERWLKELNPAELDGENVWFTLTSKDFASIIGAKPRRVGCLPGGKPAHVCSFSHTAPGHLEFRTGSRGVRLLRSVRLADLENPPPPPPPVVREGGVYDYDTTLGF